jgi:uncharacterized membrane protein YfcA
MVAGAAAMVSERARRPAEFTPWRYGVDPNRVLRMIGIGLAVGWIIGLFGVGGGFVIVPVLVLVLKFETNAAIGTSLLVVAMGATFALGDRIAAGDVEWDIAIPFAVAAALGAYAGRRIAERVANETLRRAFAVVIVIAAAYTAIRSAIDLFA